jgi:hypothetical protein
MKIELFDRHAEHLDESVPLCFHDVYSLDWGDTFRTEVNMEVPGWIVTSKLMKAEAEVEIHFISKRHIKVIINHADYLTTKRARLIEGIQKGMDEHA